MLDEMDGNALEEYNLVPTPGKKWADIWRDEFFMSLGIDKSKTVDLKPGVEYQLFVDAPNMIRRMIEESEEYSFQEYMALACFEGLKSIATGNNPIGALVIVREKGIEYIFGGHNRTSTKNSKHFHAEQDAIDAWENWEGDKNEGRFLYKRKSPPDSEDSITLVTTREPCSDMCAGRILNSRPPITKVMIANRDEGGGAFGPGHDSRLSPDSQRDWAARGGEVIMANYTSPYKTGGDIDSDFKNFIQTVFCGDVFETKQAPPPRAPLVERFPQELGDPSCFGMGLPPAIREVFSMRRAGKK